MSIHLSITNLTRAAIHTRWLAQHLRKLLKLQKVTTGNWSITIVTDHEMKQLHKRTMNDPTTTDVLTFDLRDTIKNQKTTTKNTIDLDTILCRDEAARRAKELHHPVHQELLLYALHSLLHVQGYDDLTAQQHARMHRREDALLIALGIGPLYKKLANPGRRRHPKNRQSKTEN